MKHFNYPTVFAVAIACWLLLSPGHRLIAAAVDETLTLKTDSHLEPITIRLMSFNIWVGGEPGGQPLEQTAAVIKAARADIVGIQESFGSRSKEDSAKKIAEMLGWQHVNQRGSTSVISRFPIVGTTPEKWGVMLELSENQQIYLFNAHLAHAPYQPYQLAEIEYGSGRFIKTEQEAIEEARKARGHQVDAILAEMKAVADRGLPMFLTGDLNEPSHQDWTDAAAQAGHCQIKVEYPTTKSFSDFGFTDAFRSFHPDETKVRGYTWTPINAADDPSERHDRIDFVFSKGEQIRCVKAEVVGEAESRGADIVVTPYPSDHRGVVAEFQITPAAN